MVTLPKWTQLGQGMMRTPLAIPSLCYFVIAAIGVVPSAEAQLSPKRSHQPPGQQAGAAKLEDSVKQLESADPDVRLAGVKSLDNTKDQRVIPYLIRAVADPDIRVQAKAVDILANLRADDATSVLTQCLLRNDTDPHLKQRIVTALGEIGDVQATQPLLELLQRDLDSTMRGTTIFVLGEIGGPDALDTLTKLAQTETDPTLKRIAGEAVAKVRQHQGSPVETQAPVPLFPRPNRPPPGEH